MKTKLVTADSPKIGRPRIHGADSVHTFTQLRGPIRRLVDRLARKEKTSTAALMADLVEDALRLRGAL
jgi:hypothetical protein